MDLNGHSSKEKYTGIQKAHEKMFNITNHKGTANLNHNEIASYTCQNGYYKKENKKITFW